VRFGAGSRFDWFRVNDFICLCFQRTNACVGSLCGFLSSNLCWFEIKSALNSYALELMVILQLAMLFFIGVMHPVYYIDL
jgi:hypothetical protein